MRRLPIFIMLLFSLACDRHKPADAPEAELRAFSEKIVRELPPLAGLDGVPAGLTWRGTRPINPMTQDPASPVREDLVNALFDGTLEGQPLELALVIERQGLRAMRVQALKLSVPTFEPDLELHDLAQRILQQHLGTTATLPRLYGFLATYRYDAPSAEPLRGCSLIYQLDPPDALTSATGILITAVQAPRETWKLSYGGPVRNADRGSVEWVPGYVKVP